MFRDTTFKLLQINVWQISWWWGGGVETQRGAGVSSSWYGILPPLLALEKFELWSLFCTSASFLYGLMFVSYFRF